MSAVSKKLMPSSSARRMIAKLGFSGSIQSAPEPKLMQPKQMRETLRPEAPSLTYSIPTPVTDAPPARPTHASKFSAVGWLDGRQPSRRPLGSPDTRRAGYPVASLAAGGHADDTVRRSDRSGHDEHPLHPLRPARRDGRERPQGAPPVLSAAGLGGARSGRDLAEHGRSDRDCARARRRPFLETGGCRHHQPARDHRHLESPDRRAPAPGSRLAGHASR